MVKAIFDTNILIDFLKGSKQAALELNLYDEHYISSVTWIEVMVGRRDLDEDKSFDAFVNQFQILPLDNDVMIHSVNVRKTKRLKLPDAIILATAQVNQLTLVTRNTKDFSASDIGIRVPYQL